MKIWLLDQKNHFKNLRIKMLKSLYTMSENKGKFSVCINWKGFDVKKHI